MEIKEIKQSSVWDSFVIQNSKLAPFAQSWQWGDILLSEGKIVERLAVMENNEILGVAQVVYFNLPFGLKYAFCPQGPVTRLRYASDGQAINNKQLTRLCYATPGGRLTRQVSDCWSEYFKKKNVLFWRIEPRGLLFDNHSLFLKKVIDINPRASLILDLSKTENELLSSMHQKTRYNINLAQKKNLEISEKKDLNILLDLMKKTGARDKFRLHEEKHYAQVLGSDLTWQISVLQNGRAVATAVFIGFGDNCVYLYGASDYEFRNLMAPYLLQWLGIAKGKQLGLKWYDFFGIAPGKEIVSENSSEDKKFIYDEKHQYAGVTRFKLGFGGEYFETPGTYDLVIFKNKYKFYQLLRKLRRMI